MDNVFEIFIAHYCVRPHEHSPSLGSSALLGIQSGQGDHCSSYLRRHLHIRFPLQIFPMRIHLRGVTSATGLETEESSFGSSRGSPQSAAQHITHGRRRINTLLIHIHHTTLYESTNTIRLQESYHKQ